MGFQSTRLREARPEGRFISNGRPPFQSTRLREARQLTRLGMIAATGFQSTRLREARRQARRQRRPARRFQSTRLREARRCRWTGCARISRSFNPRACVRRDDLVSHWMDVNPRVSIHAPA